MSNADFVEQLTGRAAQAARFLRAIAAERRNSALHAVAEALIRRTPDLLNANQKDLRAARDAGLGEALVDRLTLTEARIADMARGCREIASFADPLGRVLEARELANGIRLSRVSVPIGAILFIYESRPNVTIDGAALCFKSGNAVILRGGKESLHSSILLAEIFRAALKEQDIDPDAVQLVDRADREIVSLLLQRDDRLDLVIPRGGEGLIRTVVEQSRVPVIKHYKGVCHIYVHASADLRKAPDILINAKVQRPGVCNAMETLLLDRSLGESAIRSLLQPLLDKGVELYGCLETCRLIAQAKPIAYPDGYHTEYLALKLSVRVVSGIQEAIEHIERFGSRHTDAILAEDREAQELFLNQVDSSSVMVNASTRFADGGQYGLGAEVGISTDKLHARGPMGVESLTTYKWIVRGDGHCRP